MNPRGSLVLFILLMLILSLGSHEGFGDTKGREDLAFIGCGSGPQCHGEASDSLTIRLTGLPAKYTPDKRYTLQLEVMGGPAVTNATDTGQGGFDLWFSEGRVFAPDESNFRYGSSYQELSHRTNDTRQRNWTFDWLAPAPGSGNVELAIAVLAGNAQADNAGDKWVTQRVISEGSNFDWGVWIKQGLLVLLVVIGLLYLRHRLKAADQVQREAARTDEEEQPTEEAGDGSEENIEVQTHDIPEGAGTQGTKAPSQEPKPYSESEEEPSEDVAPVSDIAEHAETQGALDDILKDPFGESLETLATEEPSKGTDKEKDDSTQ